MKNLKFLVFTLMVLFLPTNKIQSMTFSQLNFSLWSEYKNVEFSKNSKEENTLKLQTLYEDMLLFVKNQNVRRVIVKILDPASHDFFNPSNFTSLNDKNFYYWAIKLNEICEVEALFDGSEFNDSTTYIQQKLDEYINYDEKSKNFKNLNEKLEWLATTNERFDPYFNYGLLIKGCTIDPENASDETCQKIINQMDQFKLLHSNNEKKGTVRTSILLKIDQKDLALANLSYFPLFTDIRGETPYDLGISLPKNFPSQGVDHNAPKWRPNQNHPLLDNVYIKMDDQRLLDCVYQNTSLIQDPLKDDIAGICKITKNMQMTFNGTPFMKGPGEIFSSIGETELLGFLTFFKFGETSYQKGKLINGSRIKIEFPCGTMIEKIVSEDPINNRTLNVTSPVSTTTNLENAQYYIPPIPINWSYPKISARLKNSIYYLFSSEFKAKNNRFFGNWSKNNVLNFFHNSNNNGFLQFPLFSSFTHSQCWAPTNNLVISDFNTIPCGEPYPEFNWELGNKVH